MNKTVCAAVLAIGLTALTTAASADSVGVVTVNSLNVREGAGMEYNIVDNLPEGEIVSVISEESSWYKILYNDGYAYVSSEYISDDWEEAFAKSMEDYRKETEKAKGEDVIEYAKTFLGIPYVYGGSTPSGFDCSGFVQYVFANFGFSLPRVSYDQMNVGEAISTDDLQPGDLLFFRSGGHVGIYAGDGQYIHAPRTGRTISVDPLNRDVYAARRIL